MFKIVPRIGTCDAGFSSSKFRSSCLPFVVKQTTLPVFSYLLLSRTTVDSNFFHGPIEFEITSQLYIMHFCHVYIVKIYFYNCKHFFKYHKNNMVITHNDRFITQIFVFCQCYLDKSDI